MGGEKWKIGYLSRNRKGSPPHGRGKVCSPQRSQPGLGITPAWAGKSLSGLKKGPAFKDHPRMGGEKRRLSECAQWAEGSPPHGRGKGLLRRVWLLPLGITPAWAGKRSGWLTVQSGPRDHPRMGGEKRQAQRFSVRRIGSPPHGRGKVSVQPNKKERMGITPAWAGKSPQL